MSSYPYVFPYLINYTAGTITVPAINAGSETLKSLLRELYQNKIMSMRQLATLMDISSTLLFKNMYITHLRRSDDLGNRLVTQSDGSKILYFAGIPGPTPTEPNTVAPIIASATISNRMLTLEFNDLNNLNPGSVPPLINFKVTVDGYPATVAKAQIIRNTKTATLTLSGPVRAEDVVTLQYIPPTNGKGLIQDVDGNVAAAFTLNVTNATPVIRTNIPPVPPTPPTPPASNAGIPAGGSTAPTIPASNATPPAGGSTDPGASNAAPPAGGSTS